MWRTTLFHFLELANSANQRTSSPTMTAEGIETVLSSLSINELADKVAARVSVRAVEDVALGVQLGRLPAFLTPKLAEIETGISKRSQQHLRDTGQISYIKPTEGRTVTYDTLKLFGEIRQRNIPSTINGNLSTTERNGTSP